MKSARLEVPVPEHSWVVQFVLDWLANSFRELEAFVLLVLTLQDRRSLFDSASDAYVGDL